ncbi:MAG: response regulator [Aestuariivirga sp.]|uniref:hybrid sensor histidine kinase/response regulator n=1 Tax=Aestuariivirga sp. TaxID=2650926 RepID=UPI0025BA52DE|nr:PAS domain-containing sensor histidine kinase [Aestuariivirga sp.]MCA3560487.1 response regulator [Aestuariivirga sp.]
MTDRNAPVTGGIAAPEVIGFGEAGRPALALLLALAVAAAAVFGLGQIHGGAPRGLLWAGAALAALGLASLLGLVAGVLRIGRGRSDRAFFDALTAAIGHPLVVTDAQGRAIYANAAYETLSARAGRLVGMDVLFAPYAEFSAPVYQLAQAVAEGRSEFRELRVAQGAAAPCASAGRPVWVKLSATPIAGGGMPLRLWQLEDISEDRAQQEQAFSRLQFIITYLDNAPAGFFSTLAGGQVDYINATLAQWLGIDLPQAQTSGMKLADLVGEQAAQLVSGVAPKPGTAVTESFGLDLRNTVTGKLIPVQLIHHMEFDAEGQPSPSRTIVVPRHLAGTSAAGGEISAPRLSRFINNAPIGIAEIGKDGIVRMANGAFLELSPKARRGSELSAAIVAAERATLLQALSAALRGEGSLHQIEANVEGAIPRNVLFTFTRLAPEDDTAVVFAVDKTENKSLEVQLAQSQKLMAVGQLASGIAHDFNNVLTPIIGFADLLLAKMRPTDPAFADVMNIKQNANRAANLVRQLLAFSRKQTLQPKVHVLTEALSDLGNLLGRVLGEKVSLKINHDRELGLVMVDIHQFEQVIINLAVNARDAMPNGGSLTVRTYNVGVEESRSIMPSLLPPGEYIACEVQDTGTGIPPEIRDKIWEPFFSTKDVGKGTGLGLSTVYGIVKQTGGFIFCDSEVGKGTTFRIYLPRYYPKTSDEAPAGEKPAEAPKRDYTGKERILLVEDEDAVRAFALRALTSRGYTVVEADSGESAIEKIDMDGKGFDLIISDVVMPEMDGPTLLRELRKRGIETKFVFVSGYPGEQFEQDLEGHAGYSFMPKPFSLKQLVEKVKEAMEG